MDWILDCMIFRRKKKKILFILFSLLIIFNSATSQDTTLIKVHFLYGSKPAKQYRDSERKWFGGILGGHVGIETNHDQVLNFMRDSKFHLIARKKEKHSRFAIHTTDRFWGIFGSPGETVKKATVIIPVSRQQKNKLDSIQQVYTIQTPYDYAFIGMRCGAATYEILAQMNILRAHAYRKTFLKIFYPKKLRKRLLKKAQENNWTILRQDGTPRRKWERD